MKITIDYKLDNWNDTIGKSRTNYRYANIVKKREMDVIRVFLKDIPRITEYPIKLDCIWHVKNVRSDLDNKSLKSVLDAMQQEGIIENDNIKHITEINHKAIKDDKDYLEIEINTIRK